MKRLILAALALTAVLLCSACAAKSIPVRIEPATANAANAANAALLTEAATMPTPGPADASAPLSIVRSVVSFGEGYIVYPRVLYCEHADAINGSILDLTAASAQQVSASIFTKYRIEYNRNGIFSLRMDLLDLYESEGEKSGVESESLETIYMTYDVEAGELCSIGDLFDQEDERWRGVMPDIITAQAEAKGMTLLCDVMPIADSQQFFISEDAVVLVYELYEIATWSAGEPEFTIPIPQLAQFIPASSPLARVAMAEMTPAPAALPAPPAEESTWAVAGSEGDVP